jgi:hypothetical protein
MQVVSRRSLLHASLSLTSNKRLVRGHTCIPDDVKEKWQDRVDRYGLHEEVFGQAREYYECLVDEKGLSQETAMHLERVRKATLLRPEYQALVDAMVEDAQDARMFDECFDI